ncbi:MAG: sulfite exporter TauE/SafE family protein [Candidatus Kerfeldbacteria bacterium]
MNFLTAFITGITTGGLTCLAVQGGLLLAILARRDEDQDQPRTWQRLLIPVAAFLLAKIVIHTLFGFGLGWFGDRIALTTPVRVWLQVIAGTFMVLTGIRLVAPRFLPWLTIMPPSAVRRIVRKNTKSRALFAPVILGLLTIFIPCGTTQAMEVASIAAGNALQAASIMLGFTLGTAPLFIIIGVLAKGTAFLQRKLTFTAAAIVIFLGLFTINGSLILTDSPYEFHNVVRAIENGLLGEDSAHGTATEADDRPVITVQANGYSPDEVTVPAGSPVTLTLQPKGNLGCTSIFRIPQLNIEQTLSSGTPTTITATFSNPGRYIFTCGMGMYRGTIIAI